MQTGFIWSIDLLSHLVRQQINALLALSAESRAEVDAVMERALAAGGKEPTPARDHGFMFQRTFQDLDGHTWEIFYMDESAFPGA